MTCFGLDTETIGIPTFAKMFYGVKNGDGEFNRAKEDIEQDAYLLDLVCIILHKFDPETSGVSTKCLCIIKEFSSKLGALAKTLTMGGFKGTIDAFVAQLQDPKVGPDGQPVVPPTNTKDGSANTDALSDLPDDSDHPLNSFAELVFPERVKAFEQIRSNPSAYEEFMKALKKYYMDEASTNARKDAIKAAAAQLTAQISPEAVKEFLRDIISREDFDFEIKGGGNIANGLHTMISAIIDNVTSVSKKDIKTLQECTLRFLKTNKMLHDDELKAKTQLLCKTIKEIKGQADSLKLKQLTDCAKGIMMKIKRDEAEMATTVARVKTCTTGLIAKLAGHRKENEEYLMKLKTCTAYAMSKQGALPQEIAILTKKVDAISVLQENIDKLSKCVIGHAKNQGELSEKSKAALDALVANVNAQMANIGGNDAQLASTKAELEALTHSVNLISDKVDVAIDRSTKAFTIADQAKQAFVERKELQELKEQVQQLQNKTTDTYTNGLFGPEGAEGVEEAPAPAAAETTAPKAGDEVAAITAKDSMAQAESTPTIEQIFTTHDEVNVKGDGWCFFYAVNGALGKAYDGEQGLKDANDLISAIKSNQKEMNKTHFETNPIYAGHIDDKKWASDYEVDAVARLYKKCIFIYISYSLNGVNYNIDKPLIFGEAYEVDCTQRIYLKLFMGSQTRAISDPLDFFKQLGITPGVHFSFFKKKDDISSKGNEVEVLLEAPLPSSQLDASQKPVPFKLPPLRVGPISGSAQSRSILDTIEIIKNNYKDYEIKANEDSITFETFKNIGGSPLNIHLNSAIVLEWFRLNIFEMRESTPTPTPAPAPALAPAVRYDFNKLNPKYLKKFYLPTVNNELECLNLQYVNVVEDLIKLLFEIKDLKILLTTSIIDGKINLIYPSNTGWFGAIFNVTSGKDYVFNVFQNIKNNSNAFTKDQTELKNFIMRSYFEWKFSVPYDFDIDEEKYQNFLKHINDIDTFEAAFKIYEEHHIESTINLIVLRHLLYWKLRNSNIFRIIGNIKEFPTFKRLQERANTIISQMPSNTEIRIFNMENSKKLNLFGGAPEDDEKEENPKDTDPALPPVPPASNPTAVVNASKEVMKEILESKKELNSIYTALENADTKWTKFKNYLEPSAAPQGVGGTEGVAAASATEAKTDAKAKTEADANAKTEADAKAKSEADLAREVTGNYSYLSEDGKRIMDEIQKLAEDQKAKIRKVFNRLTKIIEREPNYQTEKKFMDMTKHLTESVEGSFGSTETKGLINDISSYVTERVGTYNEKLAYVKKKAQGLKEQRDYDIKMKQADNKGYNLGAAFGYGKQGGGNPVGPEVKEGGITIKTMKDNIQSIITKVINPLEALYKTRINPAYALANSISPYDNLFTKIMYDYNNMRDSDDMKAKQNLVDSMRANNLLPDQVLAVNGTDKTVFVFVSLFIRLFALSITEYLIERGTIKKMFYAVISYLLLFTFIFIAFVLFVNLDMYRLRIVFNYVNFHKNSGYVYTYLLLLWTLGAFIFLIMYKLNFPNSGVSTTAISEEEKVQLISRLEILTMIVWVILSVIVAVA